MRGCGPYLQITCEQQVVFELTGRPQRYLQGSAQLRSASPPTSLCDVRRVSVDDMAAFRRAVAALTHQAIARFCDHWVYRCINLFPPSARRKGFRYQWYIDQVERCHKLLFSCSDRLNALFARLLDNGRAIGQPHVISRLFQRRLHAHRTGGRMQRTPQEDYCLKAWHKKTYIKQYNWTA